MAAYTGMVNASSVPTLHETDHLNLALIDTHHEAIYDIPMAGEDTWLEDGLVHVTSIMPACLVVTGQKLDARQLKQFIDGLDIRTQGKNLTAEQYKGTWTFVDRRPFTSTFGDTYYIIKAKDNMTFSELLQSVGANADSIVYIDFSRGCKELALPPYMPDAVQR